MGWGSTLGMVAGGAIGTLIAPGVGTGLGASLGGALGGGFDDNEVPEYHNPYEGEMRANLDQALHSHVGADQAAATAGQIRNAAGKEYQSFASNPNFAGNASVQAGAYNKIQGQAEHSIIGANLKGAELDQNARQSALGDALKMGQFDYNSWKDRLDMSRQPSAGEALLYKTLGSFAGSGAASLGNSLNGGGDTGGGDAGSSGAGSVNLSLLQDAERRGMGGGGGFDWGNIGTSGTH